MPSCLCTPGPSKSINSETRIYQSHNYAIIVGHVCLSFSPVGQDDACMILTVAPPSTRNGVSFRTVCRGLLEFWMRGRRGRLILR